MSEQKTAVGTCQKLEVDGDWHTFFIDTGGQYPLRLKTKKQATVELAQRVGKRRAEWSYSESEGNPNPHKPGTNYVNRWLDGVASLNGDEPEPDIAP